MRSTRTIPPLSAHGWGIVAMIYVLLASVGVRAEPEAVDNPWQLVRSRAGVQVYRRSAPNTKIYAVRAVARLDASPAEVVGVIADHARYTRWVDRLESARVLERQSPWDFVTYQTFDMPAMFSDRDTVIRVRIEAGPSPGELWVHMHSIDHPKAPPTIGVRAQILSATYRLKPLPGGATELDWDTLSDPGGSIPDWVINMISKSWPVKSIAAMRGELARGDTQPWPLPR